jgi:hypothetical protein
MSLERYLLTLDGAARYFVASDGMVFEIQKGRRKPNSQVSFFVRNNVVFDKNGWKRFWINPADNYLYDDSTGRATFYLSNRRTDDRFKGPARRSPARTDHA